MNRNFPISELRVVRTFFQGSLHPITHMMHEDQVKIFVEATVVLHHTSTERLNAARLWAIYVSSPSLETVSYWWCHPSLKPSPDGAQLNSFTSKEERVWAHSDLLRSEKEAEEMED